MAALVALDLLQVFDEEAFREIVAEPMVQMAIEQAALLNEAFNEVRLAVCVAINSNAMSVTRSASSRLVRRPPAS